MANPHPFRPNALQSTESPQYGSNSQSSSELGELASTLAAQGWGSSDLALDLVLHDLADRGRLATGASGAAIALERNGRMVCRAASGETAPDLGVQINADSGLTGACVRQGKRQWCSDTETDPRVNPEACRQLGVRSIVVVPLFADDRVVGVFEIFSPLADGFRERDLKTLQELASRVTEATHASTKKPVVPRQDATPVPSGGDTATESASESPTPVTSAGQAYRALLFGSNTTRILRATVLVLATVLCLMLGFRWGWQRAHGAKAARATPAAPTPVTTPQNTAIPGDSTQDITIGNLKNTSPKPSAGNRGKATTQSDTGSLAVYQDGNLVYQQKPVATRAQSQTGNSSEQLNEQSPAPPPQTATESANTNPPPKPPEPEMTASIPRTSLTAMNPGIVLPGANLAAPIPAIRVSQGITGGKLVRRVEPQYPYQAKQQRVGGDVMLQAVIGKDGRVHDIKTIRGNEMLAAAAMNAVRQWRYEPYKLNGDPVEMQTEITIKFALP